MEKKRLRYIDAMRGLAILLVVFSHVSNAYVKMPITNASFAGIYYMMTMFRMPLFFFVSGFFAYRAAHRWDSVMVKRVMTKKFQAQIVGLAVFSFVFGACMKGWHFNFLWTSNPYWFTISLFEMFCIYLLTALTLRKAGRNWPLYALGIISLIAPFAFNYLTQGAKLPKWCVAVQAWHTLNYFPYFMLGIFARRFEGKMWKIVDHAGFKALMIAGFLSLSIFYGCRHPYSLQWDLIMTAMRFSGLMTLLIAFRTYRDWWDKETPLSSVMGFAGSRTLDIYYLHYFFIPNLDFMKGLWSTGPGNNILTMLTFGLAVSALVVALCLLVSAVLRSSPLLAQWLFGTSSQQRPHKSFSRRDDANVDPGGVSNQTL